MNLSPYNAIIRQRSKLQTARGACLVEGAISAFFALMMVLVSFDIITLFRYASAAYSVAITTARVGSVETPGDPSMSVPPDTLLKVPASNPFDYLQAWRQYTLGSSAPNFKSDILRALNLGHGWAKDLLGPRFRTVDWNHPSQAAANVREPYEFSIVPRHYQFANTTSGTIEIEQHADYECCITVPLVVLPAKTVCRNASSTRYKL